MQGNQSLGQMVYEQTLEFGQQLCNILKMLQCYGILGSKSAMVLPFCLLGLSSVQIVKGSQ